MKDKRRSLRLQQRQPPGTGIDGIDRPHPSISGAISRPLPILRPGWNCWRTAPARRAAFLVDGARYFDVAAEAIGRARHSILLLAWDFVPETELNPGDPPDQRRRLRTLLNDVAERRPELAIRVLIWDKAAFFALKQGKLPGSQSDAVGAHVDLRFDDFHPPLACHHQKILVIDDALAFCGGVDFADNRWDTTDHLPDDPRRISTTGDMFEPRHDIMIAVDGGAASALGELARDRWFHATGEWLAPAPGGSDPWPPTLAADLTAAETGNLDIGIARTLPLWQGQPEIREVERLYVDAIAAARRMIYLESQYFASHVIADAVARRLTERDGPEVVIIVPDAAPTWIEQQAMDGARSRLITRLHRADRFGRFRIYAPMTGDQRILVHSKLMIADDRFVRIGSANLNERSLGVDTECDLAVEATAGQPGIRSAIRRLHAMLLAEHLGTSPAGFEAALARHGSLIAAIQSLNHRSRRYLKPVEADPDYGLIGRFLHDTIADPRRPWGVTDSGVAARRLLSPMLTLAAAALAGGILAAVMARVGRR